MRAWTPRRSPAFSSRWRLDDPGPWRCAGVAGLWRDGHASRHEHAGLVGPGSVGPGPARGRSLRLPGPSGRPFEDPLARRRRDVALRQAAGARALRLAVGAGGVGRDLFGAACLHAGRDRLAPSENDLATAQRGLSLRQIDSGGRTGLAGRRGFWFTPAHDVLRPQPRRRERRLARCVGRGTGGAGRGACRPDTGGSRDRTSEAADREVASRAVRPVLGTGPPPVWISWNCSWRRWRQRRARTRARAKPTTAIPRCAPSPAASPSGRRCRPTCRASGSCCPRPRPAPAVVAAIWSSWGKTSRRRWRWCPGSGRWCRRCGRSSAAGPARPSPSRRRRTMPSRAGAPARACWR